MAYPLSLGPVSRVYLGQQLPPPPGLATFYRPLFVAAEHFRPLNRFLEWYVLLWIPKDVQDRILQMVE